MVTNLDLQRDQLDKSLKRLIRRTPALLHSAIVSSLQGQSVDHKLLGRDYISHLSSRHLMQNEKLSRYAMVSYHLVEGWVPPGKGLTEGGRHVGGREKGGAGLFSRLEQPI